jgi:GDP-4-dehydro-6-deoxy-D-mannose reductase
MSAPVLVTGAAGFAGSHLVDLLSGTEGPLIAWYRPGGRPPRPGPSEAPPRSRVQWQPVDLLDPPGVARALAGAAPRIIYHCAGSAHVGSSWSRSGATLRLNLLGTHHLLEAVRRTGLACRIFIPGSAHVYRRSERALREDDPLGPASPYGLSKLAQELLARRAVQDDGQPVLIARAFNHLGPRQDPSFAVSGFARQIALIEAGRSEPVLMVGNLDVGRDLTDVRDTVRAYRAIAERGQPGRPYNVCSGRLYGLREVIEQLLRLTAVRVEIRVDPARLRPEDAPVVVGDPTRIRDEIGWQPEIPLDRALADLLAYWRDAVRAEPG